MEEDLPPAYTEIAEHGTSVVEEGANVPVIRRHNVQTNRTESTSLGQTYEQPTPTSTIASTVPPTTFPTTPSQPAALSSAVPISSSSLRPPAALPPRPSSSTSSSSVNSAVSSSRVSNYNEKRDNFQFQPPTGPPPTSGRPNKSSYKPPSVAPPRKEGRKQQEHRHHHHHNYPPSNHESYPQQWGPPPPQNWGPPPPPQGRPHLQYPPNFYCPKCQNTGIKTYKGTSCQDCWDRFGVSTSAQYIPSGMQPVFNLPPRIVAPGDPSIGGLVCGRCRGKGYVREFLFDTTSCPICHGVGRVF